MKTLLERIILLNVAVVALGASATFAQPADQEKASPSGKVAPAPEASEFTRTMDPRSRPYLIKGLAQRLGLNDKQMEEINKVMDATAAERAKKSAEQRAIYDKQKADLLKVLTPEQKDKAAGFYVEQVLRGPLMPGPGDTGFRKMQPRGWKAGPEMEISGPARMKGPEGPAKMGGRPDFRQMMRERIAAHADDMIRARATRELELNSEQSAKAKQIETDRETAIKMAGQNAEDKFRSMLTKEQQEKYKAMREEMKSRLQGLGEPGPGTPPPPPAEENDEAE